jgi:hypothetical protein
MPITGSPRHTPSGRRLKLELGRRMRQNPPSPMLAEATTRPHSSHTTTPRSTTAHLPPPPPQRHYQAQPVSLLVSKSQPHAHSMMPTRPSTAVRWTLRAMVSARRRGHICDSLQAAAFTHEATLYQEAHVDSRHTNPLAFLLTESPALYRTRDLIPFSSTPRLNTLHNPPPTWVLPSPSCSTACGARRR